MTTQDILLARLRVLLEEKDLADLTRAPWQTPYARHLTIPAAKSLQASEILSGFSGSWASSHAYQPTAVTTHSPASVDKTRARVLSGEIPPAVLTATSRLGAPGFPEVNFPPFSWRTNRFSTKGPAFLGHPISFSVVGPTEKSPACDWQWSAVPDITGDVLIMQAGPSGAATCLTIADGYNLTGTIADYPGGLYLVVTNDGTMPGTLNAGSNGLAPVVAYAEIANYEIFRIIELAPAGGGLGAIRISPVKPLSSVFTVPGVSPAVRSIMIFQPVATRLAAVPGSGEGVGRERVFHVVSPDQASNADLYPPYDGGVPGDGTWAQGGFEATATAGEVAAYGGRVSLPVPVPSRAMVGQVEQNAGAGPANGCGFWRVTNIPPGSGVSNADEGKIIHIHSVEAVDSALPTLGDVSAILGWYQIHDVIGVAGYILIRIPESDIENGQKYFGPGPYFDTTGAAAAAEVQVSFTLHEPVESLWENAYNADAVDACRLTNLIDPTWVDRSDKKASSWPNGSSMARADRAVFNTMNIGGVATNPGSLLDLGFRMVLYPAVEDSTGEAIPDWDNPICSREVVIDSTVKTETQWVDIDYSAGMVLLSHAPPALAGGQIVPHGIVGTGNNNPRGEVVLFACCVPYSMEPSQNGTAVRVTGGDLGSATAGFSNPAQVDVASGKVYHTVSAVGALPTDDITLVGPVTDFPDTGAIDVLYGETDSQSQGTFWYTSIDYSTPTAPILQGISTDAVVVPTLPALAVLRRNPEMDVRLDTVYGAKARSTSMRLAYGNVTMNADGSVTVMPTAVEGPAEELRAFFPLGTSSEIARFSLDDITQRWTVGSPPYVPAGQNDIGLEITRGHLFASMEQDFGVGDLKFTRWMNTAHQINQTNAISAATPANSYSATLLPAPLNYSYQALPPAAAATGMCVVLEGSTIASAQYAAWTAPPVAGQRFILNVKQFGNRSSASVDESLLRQDEGPANPTNWYSYTATGVSDTPADLTTAINGFYNGLPTPTMPAEVLGVGGTARLFLTERQVSVMPVQPYIQSAPIPFPAGITFNPDAALIMTIKSADPKNGCAERWITIQIAPGGIVSASSDAIALHLNTVMYNPLAGVAVTDLLNRAGFFATDPLVAPSQNPGLAGAGWGERQFLFIGDGDPRHPAPGSNTVCLLCGGWGSSDAAGSARDFFNIIATTGRTEGIPTADIATILGGEFAAAPYKKPASCGLFWGPNAQAVVPGPIAADFATETVKNTLSDTMRFDKNGVEPLGLLCGSWPISEVALGPTVYVRFVVPGGEGSPLYRGDRLEPVTEDRSEKTVGTPIVTPYDERKSDQYPYLGRWAWPAPQSLKTINVLNASEAGPLYYWLSYGARAHDETGFTSPLMSTAQTGYDSFVVSVEPAALGNTVSPASLVDGDILTIRQNAGTAAGHGIFLGYNGSDKTGAALVSTRGPYSVQGRGVIPEGFQPSVLGRFSALVSPNSDTFLTSLVANPNGVTTSAAVQALFNAGNTLSTTGPDSYGEGLDGGSVASNSVRTNAVVIGGGRVNLLSLLGPMAPAGLSFSSPVIGKGINSGSVHLATTFFDHGIFSTSMTLSQGFLGAEIDPAGIFDSGRQDPDYPRESSLIGTGKSQYGDGHHVGGVGGVRISGDATVWLTNPRPLASRRATANVRMFTMTGAAPWNASDTGPVVSAGYSPGACHTPSGFGGAQFVESTFTFSLQSQEATVTLGLTRSDLLAFQQATGNFQWPSVGDAVFTSTGGGGLFTTAQAARDGFQDIPLPSLVGMYLTLDDAVGSATASNVGTWRIVGTPMLLQSSIMSLMEVEYFGYTAPLKSDWNTEGDLRAAAQGRPSESAVVAVLQIRVERYAVSPNRTVPSPRNSFEPETVTTGAESGHAWSISWDDAGTFPVYVADVVDPGGSPTGVPSSLRGLTLVPDAATGQPWYKMDLVSVFPDGMTTDEWPLVGSGLLIGIHESSDHRGRSISRAVFTGNFGVPASFPTSSYARATIFSSLRDDRLDENQATTTRGEFSQDEAGRVSFDGHPQRLGPGILFDGGLGMVQATAFRSTPKPLPTESLGALTVYGQNSAYPLPGLFGARDGRADMPSTFNSVEFYGDTTIVGPYGTLVFEDGRAAHGLVANMRPSSFTAHAGIGAPVLHAVRGVESLDPTRVVGKTRVAPADSLFPNFTSGIKFARPGGVFYERVFRNLDATGGFQSNAMFNGAHLHHGFKGLEIPAFGDCLLLPKGPPTTKGKGDASVFWSAPSGATPLDMPLYEFDNDQIEATPITDFTSPVFWIRARQVFSAVGKITPPAVDGPPPAAGQCHQTGCGSMSQAYRHSHSRASVADYAVSGTSEQVRVLDGMVIEDVTNGTFYTVGDVGRWKQIPNITAGLRQPGDAAGVRSSVNGALVVNGISQEIIYDIGPYCDPTTNPLMNQENGMGDRVDNLGGGPLANSVRRPLIGHHMRITPNVEFVPVQGPRDVDGGLLPAYTDPDDSGTQIDGADAIFYSLRYQFNPAGASYGAGDVGRFLYICGTNDYVYTGWWVIINVLTDYPISGIVIRDVAVLRKWKRDDDRAPDTVKHDGGLPLTYHSPLLTMAGDHDTNGVLAGVPGSLFSGVAGEYSDLSLWITKFDGTLGFSVTVAAAALAGAGVNDTTTFAAYCNGQPTTNGADAATALWGAPIPNWIVWTSTQFADGSGTVKVFYDLTLLSNAQLNDVIGNRAALRVRFLSNNVGHALGGGTALGFYSYTGSNSEVDRGNGDRNNALIIHDASAQPDSYSAAKGLRWVFSSPLTEEQVGNYLHLTKPNLHRFGVALASQGGGVDVTAWSTGHPVVGDTFVYQTDIFRLNRCPTTSDIVVGGDCERYQVELCASADVKTPGPITLDSGKGRPVLYSPLSLWGAWPHTDTGMLPGGVTLNAPILYALQPIAREKIVTVSPNSARSVTQMVHGDWASGNPFGVGPRLAYNANLAMDVSEPWRLTGRHEVEGRHTTPGPIPPLFTEHAGRFNSDPTRTYCWTPAGEWWQLWVPAEMHGSRTVDDWPTLRWDLTESFTQAMGPGAGINSPYPGHAPKGVRLNRIWVNYGVWGQMPIDRTNATMPGTYVAHPTEVLHITFNLVVEIPGSETRVMGGDHPINNGTGGLPFGDRAPYAASSDVGTGKHPGGTFIVPLSVNREAGDLMPNVMERFLTAGPYCTGLANITDWTGGDFEYGFGASNDGATFPLQTDLCDDGANHYPSNSCSPVVWGGYDQTTLGTSVTAQASVFPRLSRVSGGIRADFSTNIAPNLVHGIATLGAFSNAAVTGLTLTHACGESAPVSSVGGNSDSTDRSPYSCPHAFTMALTPVGDILNPASPLIPILGRTLKNPQAMLPAERPFKVGNWLDNILVKAGVPAPSGSMLPPGARVFLEVTASPGDQTNYMGSGVWIAAPKVSFEVETPDGVAVTENVNVLGQD